MLRQSIKYNDEIKISKKDIVKIDWNSSAVDDLVNRPWWSRVWVVQEFGLFKSLLFLKI